MNKRLRKAIQYILFLAVGIFIFYLGYRDFEWQEFENELKNINYWWISLVFVFGVFSHISRAVRWKMLIEPLGHKPGIINMLFSVLVLYFVNIIIPRGGELARCTVINKYEKIPFTKLFGTVVTERFVDILVLFLMVFIVLVLQLTKLDEFLTSHPEFELKFRSLFTLSNAIVFVGILLLLVLIVYMSRRILANTLIWKKIREYAINFKEGLLSIRKVERIGWFIFHSLFIYAMYYAMFHMVFLSFEPMANITLLAGLSAFIAGGLAMLAPVQAGIGAWHFMVYETLVLFGFTLNDGKIFALISHSFTNLLVIVVGILSFALLPLINAKTKKQPD